MELVRKKPLTPIDCLNLPFEQSIVMLKEILGEDAFLRFFQADSNLPSPLAAKVDTSWTKTIKIIGINPRMTKTYWGIVKYAMTFPEEGIHIMPLFETGDKGSLYAQNSWKLNPEFMDKDLFALGFDTAQKQLKLTINILHAMGKIVGIDALPHVDAFSEIVILNPQYFEWAKLNEAKTAQLFPPEVDYNTLYKEVEAAIIEYTGAPQNLYELSEEQRDMMIFPQERLGRRIELMNFIRSKGLEPIPVTEHIPSRPVVFEKIETDDQNSWAKFGIENKSQHSKIIGCITPYKWYRIDKDGYPVKNAIEQEVWDYFINKTYDFQKEYNFDFIRCDMGHNQISHSHNDPEKDTDNVVEMWAKLKEKIQKDKPYFATLGEAFYNNYYVSGFDDMRNKKFDIILGNMNYKFLNSEYIVCVDDFLHPFRENFDFNPCICVFSQDSDKPENNKYYQSQQANEARFFTGLFLNLPSYVGMGFEVRNLEPKDKAEFSAGCNFSLPYSYKWGSNEDFFNSISEMRKIYAQIKHLIDFGEFKWLGTENDLSMSWVYSDKDNSYLFAVNLNFNSEKILLKKDGCLLEKFSKVELFYANSEHEDIEFILEQQEIKNICIGDCVIYKLLN